MNINNFTLVMELRTSTVVACERKSPATSLLDLASQLTFDPPISHLLIAAQSEFIGEPTIGYQVLTAMKHPRATPFLLLCEPGHVLAMSLLTSAFLLGDPYLTTELLLMAIEPSTDKLQSNTTFTSYALRVRCGSALNGQISPSDSAHIIYTVAAIHRLMQQLDARDIALRVVLKHSSMNSRGSKRHGHFAVYVL